MQRPERVLGIQNVYLGRDRIGKLTFPFPLQENCVAYAKKVEMHWHPNASEWQYWIAGKGRMTVYFPANNARTVDFNANDVGFVPIQSGHFIENTGDIDVVFLELFAAEEFQDVSLNNWLRHLPAEIVKAHLGFDQATLDKIPSDKLEVV